MEIKGIGLITVSGFIAEVGDIGRFDNPKQLQKLAGYAIVANDSGKHNGESRISYRGRKRLRYVLYACMREFRNVFKKKSVILLYLFIEKYKKSSIKGLRSFAKGLENDLDAVENAVAYDYSNGFVEGTNSRLKMIKRTMYGKCNRELLEAKLCYMRQEENG